MQNAIGISNIIESVQLNRECADENLYVSKLRVAVAI